MAVRYFEAANPSIERQVYSVQLPADGSSEAVAPTLMTDTSKPSYYSSSFSPKAGFYLLNYHGPGIPWQKILQAGNACKRTARWDDLCLIGFYSIPTHVDLKRVSVKPDNRIRDGYDQLWHDR